MDLHLCSNQGQLGFRVKKGGWVEKSPFPLPLSQCRCDTSQENLGVVIDGDRLYDFVMLCG